MSRSNIQNEKDTVALMVAIYCRSKHGTSKNEMCDECRSLVSYASKRLDRCPFGEKKSACNSCKIHCYTPLMRQHIKEVMKYSGPRMILHDPIAALRHMWQIISN